MTSEDSVLPGLKIREILLQANTESSMKGRGLGVAATPASTFEPSHFLDVARHTCF